jgi:hypothetical protein
MKGVENMSCKCSEFQKTTASYLITISGNTVNLLNLFNVVTERPFQKVSYVLIVEHLITLSMITMVAKVNINAKYVVKHL